MKSFMGLILFTMLINLTLPVLAIDANADQSRSNSKPPLKVLGSKQHKTTHPSLPLQPTNQAQMNGAIEDIHDIQGPVILPEPKNFLIPIIIGALILLLIGLIFYFIQKKKKSAPPLPAHEVALAELARAKTWMNENKGILYAQTLSKILRQYIESRFLVLSSRKTTDELLTVLQSDSTSTDQTHPHLDDLQVCLEQCDMAKFAHLGPDSQSMVQMESAVLHFIETTKPIQPAGKAI